MSSDATSQVPVETASWEHRSFFLDVPQGHSIRLERQQPNALTQGLYTGDFSTCLLIALVKGDRASLFHADITSTLSAFISEVGWVEHAENLKPVAAQCEITIFYDAALLASMEQRLASVQYIDVNLPEMHLFLLAYLRGADTILTDTFFAYQKQRSIEAERYYRQLKVIVQTLTAEDVLKLVPCRANGEEEEEEKEQSDGIIPCIQSVAIQFVSHEHTPLNHLEVAVNRRINETWEQYPTYCSTGVLSKDGVPLGRSTIVMGHATKDRIQLTQKNSFIVAHPQAPLLAARRNIITGLYPIGGAPQSLSDAPVCVNDNLRGWFHFTQAHFPLPLEASEAVIAGIPLKLFVERCRKTPSFSLLHQNILALLTQRYQTLSCQTNILADGNDLDGFILRESGQLLSDFRRWIWPDATPAWFWAQDCKALAYQVGMSVANIKVPEQTSTRTCKLSEDQEHVHDSIRSQATKATKAALDAIQELYEDATEVHWSSTVLMGHLTQRLLQLCKQGAQRAGLKQNDAALESYQAAKQLCQLSQFAGSQRMVKIEQNIQRLCTSASSSSVY